ncbi:ATP-binding protein [Streptomyces sp. SP17BM10]|uniref:ATP-binding protein n=1 Tax=Streptomyces sp. SP17BM10 TaxID=3002530 RepID=UPI002E75B8BA|nr:ATP-binding protein [Streptomyces sp. SP17BM10]MEE1785906.1 ATP-binding protein [Streptomyces sp. SP17BM10]
MRQLNSPSLTLARESLREAMARAGWPPSAVCDAELALVELIVNAWRHGETTSPVVLIVFLRNTLRVTVADRSAAFPEPRTPSALSETGRGLQLVTGLTHRWGVDPQELGKTVWFELDGAA